MRIELAGHTARLSELRTRPERYTAWFAAARRHPGHGICRCTRSGERLVIREIAGTFHLARWPREGDNHRPGCPFFSTDSRHSGATNRTRSAITLTEHGTRIALDYAFTTPIEPPAHHAGPSVGPVPAVRAPGARRVTVTGLGLLRWLWEAAGLNTWPPPSPARIDGPARPRPAATGPRRRWDDTRAALTSALAGVRLGEHPAPRLVYVVAPYRRGQLDPLRDARLAEFLAPLETPEQVTIRGGSRRGQSRLRRRRRLLIGELKDDPQPAARGLRLALRHFPRPLYLPTELGEHLTRTHPAAFTARRPPGTRRVVLALIEGSPHGYLRLLDAAVLLTTADYLPADSSHEALLAQQLVDAGREFTKPLRLADGDRALPDFVLTDTDPATVVEVWGITGRAEYDQRRHAKCEQYAADGTPVIEWDVTRGSPPDLRPGTAPRSPRSR